MTDQKNFKETPVVYKTANTRAMLVVENLLFQGKGSNVEVKIIQLGENFSKEMELPFFLGENEARILAKAIVNGQFSALYPQGKSFFGGSANRTHALKRTAEGLVPIVDAPESRKLRIEQTVDGRGNPIYRITIEVAPGEVIDKGAIQPATKTPAAKLFFNLSLEQAYDLAATLEDELIAGKSEAVRKAAYKAARAAQQQAS